MSKNQIKYNGLEVCGHKGQTILEVARKMVLIFQPCAMMTGWRHMGPCGLCVVELEGSPKLARACATVIGEDMVIKTDTEKVKESRKLVLELLLSDHKGRLPAALRACMSGRNRLPGVCGACSQR